MVNYNSTARTRDAAKIVGPYLTITAAALLARFSSLPALFAAFMADDGLVFATGALTLMAGLTLLAVHHHWNSVSACLISLIAILASVKGASLMIAPEINTELVDVVAVTPSVLLFATAVEAAMGAWLSIVGWRTDKGPRLPT